MNLRPFQKDLLMNSVGNTQLQSAVDTVAKYGLMEASRYLKVPHSTLSSRLEKARMKGIIANGQSLTDEQALSAENKQHKYKISNLQKEVDALKDMLLDQEKVKQFIMELKDHPVVPPAWTTPASKDKLSSNIPVTIWSDFHWGEVVDPAQVFNVNQYNMKTARERLRTVVDKTISLCYDHMVSPSYPGIVLMLGGDMVSGDIHEELEITNEMPSGPVLIDLLENLIAGIDKFADKFGKVWVIGVAGNHGRTNKKPRFKNRQYTNYDWMIYQLLRNYFKKDDRIKFLIPNGADAQFSVYGTRFFLTHGDNLGTNGGDGIIGLLGPVMRGDFKIRNIQGAIGNPYDVMVIGHWHQYMALPKLIVNGSLKGYDEYANLKLRTRPEPPQQALFFVNRSHGIVCHWPVRCDKVAVKTKMAADVTL